MKMNELLNEFVVLWLTTEIRFFDLFACTYGFLQLSKPRSVVRVLIEKSLLEEGYPYLVEFY